MFYFDHALFQTLSSDKCNVWTEFWWHAAFPHRSRTAQREVTHLLRERGHHGSRLQWHGWVHRGRYHRTLREEWEQVRGMCAAGRANRESTEECFPANLKILNKRWRNAMTIMAVFCISGGYFDLLDFRERETIKISNNSIRWKVHIEQVVCKHLGWPDASGRRLWWLISKPRKASSWLV